VSAVGEPMISLMIVLYGVKYIVDAVDGIEK